MIIIIVLIKKKFYNNKKIKFYKYVDFTFIYQQRNFVLFIHFLKKKKKKKKNIINK